MSDTRSPLSRHIGEALIISRGVRRMSQYELAKRAGIRPNQISRYETGAVIPQISQLERLLGGLGIGHVEFFYVASVVERVARVFATCDRRETPGGTGNPSRAGAPRRDRGQALEDR